MPKTNTQRKPNTDIRTAQRQELVKLRGVTDEADYEKRLLDAAKDPVKRAEAMKDLDLFWPS